MGGLLRARHVDTIVAAGLMAHLAVVLTAADGAVLGYRVLVAADATAARDLPATEGSPAMDHTTLTGAALATIGDRFGDVLPTERIVALPLAHPK